jgi:hypothetical protein
MVLNGATELAPNHRIHGSVGEDSSTHEGLTLIPVGYDAEESQDSELPAFIFNNANGFDDDEYDDDEEDDFDDDEDDDDEDEEDEEEEDDYDDDDEEEDDYEDDYDDDDDDDWDDEE